MDNDNGDIGEALIQDITKNGYKTTKKASNPPHKRKSPSWLLPVSSLVASFGGVLFGYDIGIISGAILLIAKEFMLSRFQKELIITTLLVGGLFASLTGGFILDYFGRKITVVVNAIIFTVGAIVLTVSWSFKLLVFGRFILGFAVALSAIADCVYVSEIAPPHKRGFLVSLNELGITLGMLLAYLVNYVFIDVANGWRYMFSFSMIPAIIQGIAMLFLPASPRWMLTKGRDVKAEKLISSLWPYLDSSRELNRLKLSISSEKEYHFYQLFTKQQNLRLRMVIGCGIILFQQLTGQPTILMYAPILFKSLGFGSRTASSLATVGLGIVKVIFTIITLLLVNKLGRRTFLIAGAVLMTISLMTLSALTEPLHSHHNAQEIVNPFSHHMINKSLSNTTYLNNGEEFLFSDPLKYTSLGALMLFVVGYSVGYGPMSWLILTEIFPTGIKGRAVGFATSINWLVNIIISLTFLDVLESLGPFWTFLSYTMIGVLSIFFICHFVPETKGKSLEMISSYLNTKTIGCSAVRCCERGDAILVEDVEENYLLDEDDMTLEISDSYL